MPSFGAGLDSSALPPAPTTSGSPHRRSATAPPRSPATCASSSGCRGWGWRTGWWGDSSWGTGNSGGPCLKNVWTPAPMGPWHRMRSQSVTSSGQAAPRTPRFKAAGLGSRHMDSEHRGVARRTIPVSGSAAQAALGCAGCVMSPRPASSPATAMYSSNASQCSPKGLSSTCSRCWGVALSRRGNHTSELPQGPCAGNAPNSSRSN